MIEIRWHARAGQGAKTAAHVFALALLRSGRFVQAFPEYGPERRGAPVRAYTRVDEQPIRRHDSIETPDLVVVLEASLVEGAAEGLRESGTMLVNTDQGVADVHERAAFAGRIAVVPAATLAASVGSTFANEVMLGAAAGVLGIPSLDALVAATREVLGKKLTGEQLAIGAAAIAAGRNAVAAGEDAWAA